MTTLFANLPRRKRHFLMHVCDAGAGELRPIVQFRCGRCGTETDWLIMESITKAKRGIPCEKCNGDPL